MEADRKPLPRFWYFPSGFKAVVVMTGDDHGRSTAAAQLASGSTTYLADSPSGCSVADWKCVRATAYLFPKLLRSLHYPKRHPIVAQGFEVALHVDNRLLRLDTCEPRILLRESTSRFFAAQFPNLPAPRPIAPTASAWSDYDHQPQVELKPWNPAGYQLLLLAADLGKRSARDVHRLGHAHAVH